MADELEINKGGVVSLIDNHELGEILKPLVREIYLFKFLCGGNDTSGRIRAFWVK